MITNLNATSSPSEHESDPTWSSSQPAESNTRTPWWPAVMATVVGGALLFMLVSAGQVGLLRAIGYSAVAAFLGSFCFGSPTARLVRRIAGGLVLGGVLLAAGVIAYFFLALTVGGARIG